MAAVVSNLVANGFWNTKGMWSGAALPTTRDTVSLRSPVGSTADSLQFTLQSVPSGRVSVGILNVFDNSDGGLPTVLKGVGKTIAGDPYQLVAQTARLENDLTVSNLSLRVSLGYLSRDLHLNNANYTNLLNLNVTTDAELSVNGAAGTTGTLENDSSRTATIRKLGTGLLRIGETVKFRSVGSANTVAVDEGGIEVRGSGAQATELGGKLNLAYGTFFRNSGEANVGPGRNLTVEWDGTFENRGTFTKAGSGTVTFHSAVLNHGGVVRLSGGTTSFAGGYTQDGPGTSLLDLAGGAAAFDYLLSIQSGKVVGSGTLAGGDAAVFGPGTSLEPGPQGGGIGSITFPGALELNGATYRVDIAGPGSYDTVHAGDILLNGARLVVNNLAGSVAHDTSFTILSGTSLSGTFLGFGSSGYFTSGGQSFRLGYNGLGDVTVTAVPEPGAYMAATALGLLGWASLRRRAAIA